MDYIEIFNELAYLFQQYICFVFTAFVPYTTVKVEAAWLFSGVVLFIVAGNILAYLGILVAAVVKIYRNRQKIRQTHDKLEQTESNLTISRDNLSNPQLIQMLKQMQEIKEDNIQSITIKEQENNYSKKIF